MNQADYYSVRNQICVLAFASNLAAMAFFFALGALHPMYESGFYKLMAYGALVAPIGCFFLGWLGLKGATDKYGKRLAIASMVLSVLVFILFLAVPGTFLFPDPDTLP